MKTKTLLAILLYMNNNLDIKLSPTLHNAIALASPEQIDALWAILKYREIGIFRKLKSMAAILNVDFNSVLEETSTKNENGRLFDHETRHAIHESLLQYSK